MADRKDAGEAMGTPTDAAQPGIEVARRIAAELLDAGRAAAQSLANEQKYRAAQQVANAAEAIEQAAQSLERSDNPAAAAYTREAAESVGRLSRAIGDRSWGEIGTDIETFARRQPALFALGAVGLGFLAARFLAPPSASRQQERGQGAAASEEPSSSVAARGNGSIGSETDLPETSKLSATKGLS